MPPSAGESITGTWWPIPARRLARGSPRWASLPGGSSSSPPTPRGGCTAGEPISSPWPARRFRPAGRRRRAKLPTAAGLRILRRVGACSRRHVERDVPEVDAPQLHDLIGGQGLIDQLPSPPIDLLAHLDAVGAHQ